MKPLLARAEEEDAADAVALVVKPQPVSREEQQAKDQALRAQARVRDVRMDVCSHDQFHNMLPDACLTPHTIRDYLDIGCADGSISIAIGADLRLDRYHVFGCDVRDLPPEADQSERFLFKHYDGVTLPYCDNCFDMITIYMVLHHIPEIEPFLKEVVRVLRPGGYVMIREHNCDPDEMRVFLDVQHGFYALVLQPVVETPDFCSTFQTYFRNREEWRALLTEAGLSEITSSSYGYSRQKAFNFLSGNIPRTKKADGTIPNLLNSYYALFRKVDVRLEERWRHDRYDDRRDVKDSRDRDRRDSRGFRDSRDSRDSRDRDRRDRRDGGEAVNRERSRRRLWSCVCWQTEQSSMSFTIRTSACTASSCTSHTSFSTSTVTIAPLSSPTSACRPLSFHATAVIPQSLLTRTDASGHYDETPATRAPHGPSARSTTPPRPSRTPPAADSDSWGATSPPPRTNCTAGRTAAHPASTPHPRGTPPPPRSTPSRSSPSPQTPPA